MDEQTLTEVFGKVEYLENATVVTPATKLDPIEGTVEPVTVWERQRQQFSKPATPSHKHAYTGRVAIPDRWLHGIRYILAWKCDCGAKLAYDLVNEIPEK